ncbi:MAG: hypothetical protein Q8O30_00370 [Candidatus Omnitrophota bacterium]|nr:hypothetical protein [Candidatus Omnitrophota bacterium]
MKKILSRRDKPAPMEVWSGFRSAPSVCSKSRALFRGASFLVLLILSTNVIWANDQEAAKEEEKIAVAVFRYQMGRDYNGLYFLTVYSKNPNNDFMKKLSASYPFIKGINKCAYDDTPVNGIIDRDTGGYGTLIEIHYIKWVNESEVEVGGEEYNTSVSAEGFTYKLKKIDRRWKVIEKLRNWVS